MLLVVVLPCVAAGVAGCGNVYLKGEALTAAETSTMDAWQALEHAQNEPATPAWQKAYLAENVKQWRSFVRSARKDLTWGPKLPDERSQ